MKLDKHVVDMFTELTKPADDVKMEKTCYGTISVVDGTRYVKLDGSDLLVPAASTVKTSHGDRVTVLMRNHSVTVTGNLTAPSSGDGGSSSETVPEHQHTVADISDFPESLPANGGNADTVGNKPISQILAVKGWYELDMNELKEQGSYIVVNAANCPPTLAWGTALVFIGGTGSVVQLYISAVETEAERMTAYIRHYTGNFWTPWVNILDGGNAATLESHPASDFALKTDIPTSLPANGGNADTVDGKHRYDFVNYIGSITDVDNILNNPEYSDCPYEGVISSEVATSIGLSSVSIADEWSIKCFRGTDGSGFQIAVPIYCNSGESPKYRIATKVHILGSYVISWGTWNNFSDGGNAHAVDGKHAESFMQWLGYINDTDFLNNANYKVDYHCNISDGTIIGLPVAGWYHIVYYMHSNANGHGMQIAYPLNFDGATMIRRATGITWETWKNIADGGNAATASHQIDHYLGQNVDVLTYAASNNCPYNVNTKVRIMNCPTCPTNYGYNAADNDFWYDIYKLDNSWVQIKAYDVRRNVEFINSCCNGTWSGWNRCNDGGNAQSLNGFTASNGLDLVGNPTASGGRPVLGIFDDANGSNSFFDLRDGSRNVTRIQLSTNDTYRRPRAYYYNAASDTWTEEAYHMAAYASNAEPLTPSNVCLRNLSSGTASANTANCPSGAWYGKHS